MEYAEAIRALMHEFSLRLAECLEQKKLGVQEAGKAVLEFQQLVEAGGDMHTLRKYIDTLG